MHHMNALEKKVCTDICIIVALLPFYDARWLFATGVNTCALDTCFVFGCFPPPPFRLPMSGQALILAICVALSKLVPILFLGNTG